MKRLWSIVLALALALSIATFAVAEGDVKELHITHWAGLPREEELFQSWARKYEAAHPDVKINVESIADGYDERVLSLFAADDAPDIFYHAFSGLADKVDQGMLEPLDAYITGENPFNIDDLVSEDLIYKYKGQIYGWSNGGAPYMLFFNKGMFDAAGLEYPTNDWTWGQLAEAAKKLNVTDENGNTTVYGFQCDEYNRLWYSIFWSNGGQLFDNEEAPTQCLFNSEAGVIATDYMRDLVKTFGVAPTPGTTGALSYREAFMNEKVAMVTDGSWQGSQYSSALGDNMGVVMMPTADDGTRKYWSSACLWAIASTGDYKDIAYDIVKTYYAGLEGLLEFSDFGGDNAVTMPTLKSMLADERYKPTPFVQMCADTMQYCRVDPLFPGAGTFAWDILTAAIQEAMIMGTDSQTVLDNAVALTESEILVNFK